MWHTKSVHPKQYPLEALSLVIMDEDELVTYYHHRTPEAMDMILVTLDYVPQEAKTLTLALQ